MQVPVWDDTYENWVIPYNCKCCNKCWLQVHPNGQQLVRVDNLGRQRLWCINNGPYEGYIVVD